jgi:hypothetical protein
VRAPLAAVVIGGNISSTLLTLILVPVIYNFLDWSGGVVTSSTRRMLGTYRKDTELPGQEGERKGPASPRPAPQPGSAVTLNPSTSQPGPDAA